MSELSTLETTTSLHPSSDQSINSKRKLKKIKKSLFNFAKEEITSFRSLKVKVYKDEIKEEEDENKIKIPEKFKYYFEDYKKNKDVINQIESGLINSLTAVDSAKVEQVDSSDLVNSE